MRFASIGSGSQGNGTLIDNGSAGTILLDCGFSAREARARLDSKGISAADLAGILVTHEHGDHVKGVATLANALRVPVYATWGTYQAALSGRLDEALFQRIDADSQFTLAGLRVQAVPVPHDAREPCQFVLSGGAGQLGILSDCGSFTRQMLSHFRGCDALLLECNHDLRMLADGPYPAHLKRRVAGHYGHLSNEQAAEFLRRVAHPKLQYLVATHISQKNNTLTLALDALAGVELAPECSLLAACQGRGFDWLSLPMTRPKAPQHHEQMALDF